MSVDLEPLLLKLEALAPLLGRAKDDIDAIVSRGRSGDYKGVMQNARLVLETLLRSLVTDELKQTVGKAMLDDLVSKFRQQGSTLVPTNVLAHMGTVQAWGNLSTHDHAGSLTDAAITVGPDEVLASLNSMVAILSWYATKKGLTPAAGSNAVTTLNAPAPASAITEPALKPVVVRAPEKKKKTMSNALLGAVLVAPVLGIASLMVFRPPATPPAPTPAPAPASPPFEALDAVYGSWKEPPPPLKCRNEKEGPLLAKSATNVDSLKLVEHPSPEASYLLARALFEERKQRSDALDAALACDDFAAAEHLAGEVAIATNDLVAARAHLEKARTSAPGFLDARSKLVGVMMVQQQVDDALKEADALVLAAPDFHPGYLLRFSARILKHDPTGAVEDLCRAIKLGSTQARDKLAEMKGSCE